MIFVDELVRGKLYITKDKEVLVFLGYSDLYEFYFYHVDDYDNIKYISSIRFEEVKQKYRTAMLDEEKAKLSLRSVFSLFSIRSVYKDFNFCDEIDIIIAKQYLLFDIDQIYTEKEMFGDLKAVEDFNKLKHGHLYIFNSGEKLQYIGGVDKGDEPLFAVYDSAFNFKHYFNIFTVRNQVLLHKSITQNVEEGSIYPCEMFNKEIEPSLSQDCKELYDTWVKEKKYN